MGWWLVHATEGGLGTSISDFAPRRLRAVYGRFRGPFGVVFNTHAVQSTAGFGFAGEGHAALSCI